MEINVNNKNWKTTWFFCNRCRPERAYQYETDEYVQLFQQDRTMWYGAARIYMDIIVKAGIFETSWFSSFTRSIESRHLIVGAPDVFQEGSSRTFADSKANVRAKIYNIPSDAAAIRSERSADQYNISNKMNVLSMWTSTISNSFAFVFLYTRNTFLHFFFQLFQMLFPFHSASSSIHHVVNGYNSGTMQTI